MTTNMNISFEFVPHLSCHTKTYKLTCTVLIALITSQLSLIYFNLLARFVVVDSEPSMGILVVIPLWLALGNGIATSCGSHKIRVLLACFEFMAIRILVWPMWPYFRYFIWVQKFCIGRYQLDAFGHFLFVMCSNMGLVLE